MNSKTIKNILTFLTCCVFTQQVRNVFTNNTIILCFILFACNLYTSELYAQRENVWAFGANAGIDFSNGSPVPIHTAANDYESDASVCDITGHLLFYTDGYTVYNNTGQIMSNGDSLITGVPSSQNSNQPTASTTQGALIVPMPDSANKYYIFSLTASQQTFSGRLYYSIVDMSVNNTGAVDPSRKGILLDTGLTESLTGMAGNQCDVWIIVRSRIGLQFKAYNITASGINTDPVISGEYLNDGIADTGYNNEYQGAIVVSPNRKKIAAAHYHANGSITTMMEVDDLDPATGIISNRLLLDSSYNTAPTYYYCSFSPDNSKLYISTNYTLNLLQYDLSLGNSAAIIGSQTYIGPSVFTDLKLAPDGKIYFFSGNANLGAIEFPNLAGIACQYNPNSVTLLPNTSGGPALPNVVPAINALIISADSMKTACFIDSIVLQVTDTSITDFIWDDGSNDIQRTVYAPGTYVATYHTPPCTSHIDTFTVTFINALSSTEADTIVCSAAPLLLYAPIADATYLWQDGSTGDTYNASSSGIYTVQISKDGCNATDSLGVTFVNLRQNLGNDTVFCKEDKVQLSLNANLPVGATAMWSNGSTDSSIIINDSGTYWVTVSDAMCMGGDSMASDTVHIGEQVCDCIVVMPNAFTPNGDNKDDVMRPIVEPGCAITYLLRIYNRWGALISSTTNEAQGWDGTLNGALADIGTYMYTLEYQAGLSRKRQYMKGDITLIR